MRDRTFSLTSPGEKTERTSKCYTQRRCIREVTCGIMRTAGVGRKMVSLVRPTKNGVRIRVKVKPGARQSRILGIRGDALLIAVAEVPERGKANASVCALLAEMFGLPRSRVAVVHGLASPQKTLEIAGISLEAAETILARALHQHNPH